MKLSQIKIGESCEIIAVNLPHAECSRLASLGIKSGVRVEVLAFSLFKSGVLISFQGVRVGIRHELAQNIEVTK